MRIQPAPGACRGLRALVGHDMVVVYLRDRPRRIVPGAVRIAIRHTGQDDRRLHGELRCLDQAGQVMAAFDLRDVVAYITDQ